MSMPTFKEYCKIIRESGVNYTDEQLSQSYLYVCEKWPEIEYGKRKIELVRGFPNKLRRDFRTIGLNLFMVIVGGLFFLITHIFPVKFEIIFGLGCFYCFLVLGSYLFYSTFLKDLKNIDKVKLHDERFLYDEKDSLY